MIDELLFVRGGILTKIGDKIDDFDAIIADHYFTVIMGLDGEVYDSNGSEYMLNSIDKDDNFDIIFTVYDTRFETNGTIIEFDELIVSCSGAVIQEDGIDILDISEFTVLSKK